jgi:hypothetical protein
MTLRRAGDHSICGMPRALLRLLAAAGIASAALLRATGSSAEVGPGVTVTAVVGEARGGGDRLAQSSAVDPGEAVSTGRDGGCALLFDADALVQLCSASRVSLDRRAADGARIVRVEAGEARVVLDPDSNERIEIHTPAAIATLLGTVVYVHVDESTGETTITSEDHELEVTSAEPGVKGSVRLRAGERVSLRPGEPPPARPERLASRDLSRLGGCLVDFESVALDAARAASQAGTTVRVEGVDVTVADSLPAVGLSDGGEDPRVETPGEPIDGPLLDPDDKPVFPGELAAVEPPPPPLEPPPPCELSICFPGPLGP